MEVFYPFTKTRFKKEGKRKGGRKGRKKENYIHTNTG
jgi:hypothetical protein